MKPDAWQQPIQEDDSIHSLGELLQSHLSSWRVGNSRHSLVKQDDDLMAMVSETISLVLARLKALKNGERHICQTTDLAGLISETLSQVKIASEEETSKFNAILDEYDLKKVNLMQLRDRHRTEREEKKQEMKMIQNEVEDIKSEIGGLVVEAGRWTSHQAQLSRDKADLEKKLEFLREQNVKVDTDVDTLQHHLRVATSLLEHAKEEKSSAQSLLEALQSKLVALSGEVTQSLSAIRDRRQDVLNKLESYEDFKQAEMSQLRDLDAQRLRISEELKVMASERGEITAQIRNLSKNVDNILASSNQLAQTYHTLLKRCAFAALKASAQAAKCARINAAFALKEKDRNQTSLKSEVKHNNEGKQQQWLMELDVW